MKITIEHYGHKIIFEEPHDDQDLTAMCELFGKILRAMGYYFNGEVCIEEEV